MRSSKGYDGKALRYLAGLMNPVAEDIPPQQIDSPFTEMGVAAPLTMDYARLVLATEAAAKALDGGWNVFDAATHIRIHLCELKDPPPELRRIVTLSKQAGRGGTGNWEQLETELKKALQDFVHSRK